MATTLAVSILAPPGVLDAASSVSRSITATDGGGSVALHSSPCRYKPTRARATRPTSTAAPGTNMPLAKPSWPSSSGNRTISSTPETVGSSADTVSPAIARRTASIVVSGLGSRSAAPSSESTAAPRSCSSVPSAKRATCAADSCASSSHPSLAARAAAPEAIPHGTIASAQKAKKRRSTRCEGSMLLSLAASPTHLRHCSWGECERFRCY